MEPQHYDYHSPTLGFSAKVVIDNTQRGPALGGARLWQYETDEKALDDASRLAAGMTYKAALAGLDLGGGKACIYFTDRGRYGTNRVPDIDPELRPLVFREFGAFIDSLDGKYITAEDVGTAVQDMQHVHERTNHVVGLRERHDGRPPSGDPSPITALGVFHGMKACAAKAYGDDSLRGRTIALQGLGKVGTTLAGLLANAGAELYVCDMKPDRVEHIVKRYKAIPVPEDAIHSLAVDIYSPNARGENAVTPQTIGKLRCTVVAGAANNQLWGDKDVTATDLAAALRAKGIIYAPDFAINAGGLINVYREIRGYDKEWAHARARELGTTIEHIIDRAAREGITTRDAARKLAEERLRSK